MRAPEGWPAASTPRATAGVAVSCPCGGPAGVECWPAPTWPARAKGRQSAPGSPRLPPGGRPAAGECCAAVESAVDSRGAIPVRRPTTARRAPRALEDVEKVVTIAVRTVCVRTIRDGPCVTSDLIEITVELRIAPLLVVIGACRTEFPRWGSAPIGLAVRVARINAHMSVRPGLGP
jgi:hypothetical protein